MSPNERQTTRVAFGRTGGKSSYYVYFDGVSSAMITKRGTKWIGKMNDKPGFVESTSREGVVNELLAL